MKQKESPLKNIQASKIINKKRFSSINQSYEAVLKEMAKLEKLNLNHSKSRLRA